MRSPTKTPTKLPDDATLAQRKATARTWFEGARTHLRRIRAIEAELSGTHRELAPGRFERKAWQREPGRRRGSRRRHHVAHARPVFERWASTSRPCSASSAPSSAADPRRRAGSALLATASPGRHMLLAQGAGGPHEPRRIVTTRWFGGGADLTPMVPHEPVPRLFHAALKTACDRHDAAYLHASSNGATNTSPAAPRRAARRRRHLLRRSRQRRLRARLRVYEERRRGLPSRSTPAGAPAHERPWTEPARPQLAGAAAMSSSTCCMTAHQVRPDDRRQCRGDPDVPAARGALAVIGGIRVHRR